MHTYLTVSYFNPLREGAKGMGVVLIPLIIFFGKKTHQNIRFLFMKFDIFF